jgi:hypothetical protein
MVLTGKILRDFAKDFLLENISGLILSDIVGFCMILPFLGGITKCGSGKSNRGTKARIVVPKF